MIIYLHENHMLLKGREIRTQLPFVFLNNRYKDNRALEKHLNKVLKNIDILTLIDSLFNKEAHQIVRLAVSQIHIFFLFSRLMCEYPGVSEDEYLTIYNATRNQVHRFLLKDVPDKNKYDIYIENIITTH